MTGPFFGDAERGLYNGPYDDGLGPPHIHPDVQGLTSAPGPSQPGPDGVTPGEGGER